MPRTRLIHNRPGSRVIPLREDYLIICDDDFCAAMLLAQMEHWHMVKMEMIEQAQLHNEAAIRGGETATQDIEAWVYKSQAQAQSDLLGRFGENKIGTAFALLIQKGFLQVRRNPKYAWDNTRQYLFDYQAVQSALDVLPSLLDTDKPNSYFQGVPLLKIKETTSQNQEDTSLELREPDFNSKTTIPEETLQKRLTKETPKKESAPPPPSLSGEKSSSPQEPTTNNPIAHLLYRVEMSDGFQMTDSERRRCTKVAQELLKVAGGDEEKIIAAYEWKKRTARLGSPYPFRFLGQDWASINAAMQNAPQARNGNSGETMADRADRNGEVVADLRRRGLLPEPRRYQGGGGA